IIDQLWSGKMKDRARALYLKDHVLTVAVLSPVLGQELKNREAEIIDYINEKIGAEAVDRLRYIS
ncbi:MAG: DciA family protein, partial [Candidatus Komeilibacteria bacterium]